MTRDEIRYLTHSDESRGLVEVCGSFGVEKGMPRPHQERCSAGTCNSSSRADSLPRRLWLGKVSFDSGQYKGQSPLIPSLQSLGGGRGRCHVCLGRDDSQALSFWIINGAVNLSMNTWRILSAYTPSELREQERVWRKCRKMAFRFPVTTSVIVLAN